MINYNGSFVDSESSALKDNRAFLFGDAVFETMKIVDNRILFLEDHYFRLMASMRIIRMEIPMNFTMEFFQEEILNLAITNSCENSGRVRFTVFRNDGGYYLPQTNQVSYLIDVNPLENTLYQIEKSSYEVDLFKDSYISKQLISTIKSTNKLINITGSIFASENGFDTCLLLNDSKNVVEALHGNLFMLMGNNLITPPISEGCLNGVMRKQIIEIAKKIEKIEVIEEPISPFDLQKADELFLTNVIKGIQPITQYRRKTFGINLSNQLLSKLNIAIQLG
jgi:branched-chain amino acid aminotransferase